MLIKRSAKGLLSVGRIWFLLYAGRLDVELVFEGLGVRVDAVHMDHLILHQDLILLSALESVEDSAWWCVLAYPCG